MFSVEPKMDELTTQQRLSLVFQHKTADRVPIIDGPWESTLARWHREGLPHDFDWFDYFGVDTILAPSFSPIFDASPRFEVRVIEETESYIIQQDQWGLISKNFKPVNSTPLHIDSMIKNPQTWRAARPGMTPSRDRIDWSLLKEQFKTGREKGGWIIMAPWMGFDIVCTRMINSQTVLMALAEDPGWIVDMFNTGCDLSLALLDIIWQEGYHFDELMWFDDMAYKNGMLISKKMWRNYLRPYQKRMVDWAHTHGIPAHLHCCGNISSLIPELIEMGIDALDPMEIKAGMNPIQIKHEYGNDLVLRGGFDIQIWSDPARYETDIRKVLPVMMQDGGYIFSSDHSIADSVSLSNFLRILELVKEVGRY